MRQSYVWNHLYSVPDLIVQDGTLIGLERTPPSFLWQGTMIFCEPYVHDVDDTVTTDCFNIMRLATREQHLHDTCVMLFTYEPHGRVAAPLNHPTLHQHQLANRVTCEAPKTIFPTRCEVGLIAFDVTDEAILLHHVQIDGFVKSYLSSNDYNRLCRAMLRAVAATCSKQIVAPTVELIDQFFSNNDQFPPIPIHGYKKRVFAKEGFVRRPMVELGELYEALVCSDYVDPSTEVWCRP